MGGEKTVKIILWHSCQGSPPRRRGKVVAQVVQQVRNRITPAWAGKSVLPTRHCQIPKDHPRVGGEKFVERTAAHLPPGSPPRRRGKVPLALQKDPKMGITPA